LFNLSKTKTSISFFYIQVRVDSAYLRPGEIYTLTSQSLINGYVRIPFDRQISKFVQTSNALALPRKELLVIYVTDNGIP